MAWRPMANWLLWQLPWPETSTVAVHTVVAPSMNITLPVGVEGAGFDGFGHAVEPSALHADRQRDVHGWSNHCVYGNGGCFRPRELPEQPVRHGTPCHHGSLFRRCKF